MRSILLLLLGIPLPIVILIALFVHGQGQHRSRRPLQGGRRLLRESRRMCKMAPSFHRDYP